MRIFLVYIAVFLIAVFSIYYVLFDTHNYEQLRPFQQKIAKSVLNSFEEHLQKVAPEKKAIIEYDALLSDLSLFNRMFADKIFRINPSELGFKGPYYSVDKPVKLRMIESVTLKSRTETGIQYLPEHVYKDYLKMMDNMKKDIGRKLYIDSGYRSPGRQAYLFFYYLVKTSNYSLKENARWIAMPGYSEHGHPVNTAVDFCSIDGINGFSDNQTASDFVKLPEYEWMLKNAAKYNFYLSYPEENKFGVAFEPWHWHWEKK